MEAQGYSPRWPFQLEKMQHPWDERTLFAEQIFPDQLID